MQTNGGLPSDCLSLTYQYNSENASSSLNVDRFSRKSLNSWLRHMNRWSDVCSSLWQNMQVSNATTSILSKCLQKVVSSDLSKVWDERVKQKKIDANVRIYKFYLFLKLNGWAIRSYIFKEWYEWKCKNSVKSWFFDQHILLVAKFPVVVIQYIFSEKFKLIDLDERL